MLTKQLQDQRIKLWLDDLRKPENQQLQGREFLCKNEKYCCLGRLCEIALLNGLTLDKRIRDNSRVDYDDAYGFIPYAVQEWIGLKSTNGDLCTDEKYETLTILNDKGLTFTQMADVIEQNKDKLFYKPTE